MLTGRISNRLRIGSNSGNSVKFNTQQGECEGDKVPPQIGL